MDDITISVIIRCNLLDNYCELMAKISQAITDYEKSIENLEEIADEIVKVMSW